MESALSPQLFAIFSSLVEDASGLHYSDRDRELFGAKVIAHAQEQGFDALLDYYYRLRYDDPGGAELARLIEALLIHETYFFRELPPLVQLVETHLEPMIRARGRVRIWSAACSSGEEPYTVAMLLDGKGLLDRAEIIATDLSAATIERARQGKHGGRAIRDGHPRDLAQRYLEISPGSVRVDARIREAVQFSTLNLVEDGAGADLGLFDAILCRNVLIYFDDAQVTRVIDRLARHLLPDGLLAVGVSESLLRFGTTLACDERGHAFLLSPREAALTRRPRALVVDDSAFARTVLSRILRASGAIDVVATARDGRDALERIDALDPDVITLDLTMPELDGLGVLRALAGRARPRVVVVSMSGVDTDLGVEALALGAVDLVTKPTALASDRLNELGAELVAKVSAAAASFLAPAPVPAAVTPRPTRARPVELICVGTSTGGPQALTRLLAGLPATLRAPVVMVLHIPVGYTEALAARLDKGSALHVVEARDGLELVPGLAVLARAGQHLTIAREGGGLRARLASAPIEPFMPSVNQLFTSAAAAVGAGVLGVVLTGMGDDGTIGARAIAAAGGALLTEDASTCVVYGMPRSVFDAGLDAVAIPLDRMAAEIARRA